MSTERNPNNTFSGGFQNFINIIMYVYTYIVDVS